MTSSNEARARAATALAFAVAFLAAAGGCSPASGKEAAHEEYLDGR